MARARNQTKKRPAASSTAALVSTAAEQDALAEQATRTQRKENQSKSTRVNWDPKQKEFIAWTKQRYGGEQCPELVDGTKLHSFLAHEQVGRPTKRPRKTGASTEEQAIGYSTIEAYTNAIIDLWQSQVDLGINSSSHPRTAAVKALLHNVQTTTAARNAAAFKDKRAAADDGYDHEFYRALCQHFLQDGSPVGTRSLLAQVLGHQCLFRGINLRKICLSDLELGEMPNSLSPARILILRTNESKKNRTGRTEYSGALRHSESLLDPHFALALYLFQRFHLLSEPFPDLSSNSAWYSVRLLRGQDDVVTPISYDTHKNPITKAFKALGLTGCKKVTHAARGSGAREAELLEVSSTDISRLGSWKASKDAMEQSYLTHLPVRALRAMGGFHPNGGTYYLPRDTLEPTKELQNQIFPQVEQWQLRIDEGKVSTSGGVDKFLALLHHLRRVLLQDAPNLVKINPAHPVLQSPIFRSAGFQAWSKQQSDYLNQHIPALELSLRTVVPTITDKLERLSQQQVVIQQQLTRMQESKEGSEELSRRRDEAIMYEIQRHSETMRRLQTAPTTAFSSSSGQSSSSQQHSDATQQLSSGISSSSPSTLQRELELPGLGLPPLPPPAIGTLFSSSTSTSLITSASAAAAVERVSGAQSAEEAAQYQLSGAVKTVAQAWQEWNVGFAGGPSLRSLEKEFGTAWCGGPSTAKRRSFLRRMVIIKTINDHQSGTVDDAIIKLDRQMGSHSLDWLRKQLGARKSSAHDDRSSP
ncbi:hypothetical protein CF335_g8195 [Tilletia laevis]|nr:hypothetical protein CF335_g8195 [Tilletia laevis]